MLIIIRWLRVLPKMMRRRNWSEIPGDILGSISLRLSFFDTLSFSGVCSSWRIASKEFCNRKTFPLLLFFTQKSISRTSYANNDKSESHIIIIRKEGEGKLHVMPYTRWDWNIFCRPEYEIWYNVCTFSINDDMAYVLKNVHYLSGVRDDLIGSDVDGCCDLYISKLINQIQRFRFPETALLPEPNTCVVISKSILSVCPHQDDQIVVMIMVDTSSNQRVGFWRRSINEWTALEGEGYYDIAFRNNTHTLYALKIEGRFDFVSVDAWDFSSMGSGLPERKLSIEVSCLSCCMEAEGCYYHATRLVVHPSTGEVLVLAYGGTHRDDLNNKWLILNVDLGQLRCIELQTLNGEALLLGNTSSIFVSSNNLQQHRYRPNSIYFVNCWTSGTDIKLSNYSIEDAQVEHIWGCPRRSSKGFCWIVLSI